MRVERSASQIFYGYLPGQTIDLQGGIYKVKEWYGDRYLDVDKEALRRELLRVARPWEASGNDKGFARRLRGNETLRAVSLDHDNGVTVERFPNIFQCRACNRIANGHSSDCKCGAKQWGQMPFVKYHSCGEVSEPWIPRCEQHNDVKVVFPGSSSARDIIFMCPTCNKTLQKGFSFGACDSCGSANPQPSYTVHRAASVFTPRTVVIVNATSSAQTEALRAEGGGSRALAWVLKGMPSGGLKSVTLDSASMVATLMSSGLTRELAETMAQSAVDAGELSDTDPAEKLPAGISQFAQDQAKTIVSALSESRTTLEDLIERTNEDEPLGLKYRSRYPLAIHRAGLESVELIDRFPVLTGHFGYTRGPSEPGVAKLRTWKDRQSGQQKIYADLQKTEALFIRLDPLRVHAWLVSRGHELTPADSAVTAREAILEKATIPEPGSEPDEATVGTDVLTLVHSVSHRLVRQAAVLAGLDRNSLSELLVASHLGFFLFAASRGDFVLGGLQAVFETELDRLMNALIGAEHRCAMDPGCRSTGGACVACLHLGEPSCRYFNRFLERPVLFGEGGYFSTPSQLASS